MFTGLVQDQGTLTHVTRKGDMVATIAPKAKKFTYGLGDSILCNGICLTVASMTGDGFTVSLSAETLRVTTAANWKEGDVINLEPSLAFGDKLGGHLVSGHVDAVAKALSNEKHGDSVKWTFELPASLQKFLAAKGSITIDGVSLTINEVTDKTFSVMIIPHTQGVTHFGFLKAGDSVNLEVDMLARYVARQLEARA